MNDFYKSMTWNLFHISVRGLWINRTRHVSKSTQIPLWFTKRILSILFLLFINDISNFTLEGCVLNMFADDVIIYASADNVELLKHKLETCMDSISRWYSYNCLSINKKKSRVMIIGSKFQLQSLQIDNFYISLDSDKLELVERAKYLGLYVKNDLSWDEHIFKTCQNMNYFIHVLRRLRRIFPRGLLLKVYKSYIQSKLEYGLTIRGCTTDTNLGKYSKFKALLPE